MLILMWNFFILTFEHIKSVRLKCTPGHPTFQISKYATGSNARKSQCVTAEDGSHNITESLWLSLSTSGEDTEAAGCGAVSWRDAALISDGGGCSALPRHRSRFQLTPTARPSVKSLRKLKYSRQRENEIDFETGNVMTSPAYVVVVVAAVM